MTITKCHEITNGTAANAGSQAVTPAAAMEAVRAEVASWQGVATQEHSG